MKTEISRFCEACLECLNPLPPVLNGAADQLDQSGDKALLKAPLAILNEIRARLRSLMDKVGHQQAYLLIFGPLKSGKSTLMNAISGAYVSEVTSLPGYPCLVYVQHSDQPHFSVTRYNGRESIFADGLVLKDVIADSHVALAQQIRATEERGQQFDPRTHFTEAIRRVDVKVPVQSLSESSTVLVDTPGLYSRMNFGYDVLTREFRDSAACAVFVVKTDNLFLEQVFEEFNQLLDLFSRIFLVINVDSNKRDLQADGTLRPSAESEHPEQIIEAFKTLSMAGPLRQAYQEKRVRIHAIDLMNAASIFLSRNGKAEPAKETPEDKQKAAFDAFLRDLTDYLNSSDYTVEFIRDSLRQGHTMCAEIRDLVDGAEINQLRQQQQTLEDQILGLDERIAAVDRLLKIDWNATFNLVRDENSHRTAEVSDRKSGELRKAMTEALENWYAGNESLKSLEQNHWNPLLVDAARTLGDETRARLTNLLDNQLGGAEPPAAVMNDLHAVGFTLRQAAQPGLPLLTEKEGVEAYRMPIDAEQIPVRKSFVDWILFRKITTVRKRLFGEDLTADIASEMKQKRLPEKSREAIYRLLEQAVKERIPSLPKAFAEKTLESYTVAFREAMLGGLRQSRERLVKDRAQRQAPFNVNQRILDALGILNEEAGKVDSAILALAKEENALPFAVKDNPKSPAVPLPASASSPVSHVPAIG